LGYIDTKAKMENVFALYMLQFLYLSVWGIIGLGLIKWDMILNEEDAYGPLMCIGVAFCSQYYSSLDKGTLKKIALVTFLLCTLGVIVSFARGAFVSLVCVVAYLLIKSKNKIKALFLACVAAVLVLIGASLFFPDNAFWKEMATSTEGLSAGTGADRKLLWTIAWEEFKDHPLFGVGPFNFGVHAPDYVGNVDKSNVSRYADSAQIWGRAIHNAYFQVLCEQGILGFVVFGLLIVSFFRTNSLLLSRLHFPNYAVELDIQPDHRRASIIDFYGVVAGLRVGMVAFLLNAVFFDVTYFNWFWDLLVLNRLVYVNTV
jgi:O-antigen ligase